METRRRQEVSKRHSLAILSRLTTFVVCLVTAASSLSSCARSTIRAGSSCEIQSVFDAASSALRSGQQFEVELVLPGLVEHHYRLVGLRDSEELLVGLETDVEYGDSLKPVYSIDGFDLNDDSNGGYQADVQTLDNLKFLSSLKKWADQACRSKAKFVTVGNRIEFFFEDKQQSENPIQMRVATAGREAQPITFDWSKVSCTLGAAQVVKGYALESCPRKVFSPSSSVIDSAGNS
jgi:hypothetical protein